MCKPRWMLMNKRSRNVSSQSWPQSRECYTGNFSHGDQEIPFGLRFILLRMERLDQANPWLYYSTTKMTFPDQRRPCWWNIIKIVLPFLKLPVSLSSGHILTSWISFSFSDRVKIYTSVFWLKYSFKKVIKAPDSKPTCQRICRWQVNFFVFLHLNFSF